MKGRVMKYVVDANITDRRRLGGKAAALASLNRIGARIPEWFALAPEAFQASLDEGLRAIATNNGVRTIQTVIAELRTSDEVEREIAHAVATLCPDGARVAVRSSAMDEDGHAHSYAGQ